MYAFPPCHIISHPLCGAARKEDSRMSEEVIVRLGAPTLAGIKTEACSPVRILPAKAWKNLCGSLTAALLRKGSACCRCVIPKRTFSFICSARRSFPAICKTVKLPSCSGRRVTLRKLRKMSCSAHAQAAQRRRVPARDRAVSQLSPRGCKGLYRKSRRQLQAQRPVEGLRRREESERAFCQI